MHLSNLILILILIIENCSQNPEGFFFFGNGDIIANLFHVHKFLPFVHDEYHSEQPLGLLDSLLQSPKSDCCGYRIFQNTPETVPKREIDKKTEKQHLISGFYYSKNVYVINILPFKETLLSISI